MTEFRHCYFELCTATGPKFAFCSCLPHCRRNDFEWINILKTFFLAWYIFPSSTLWFTCQPDHQYHNSPAGKPSTLLQLLTFILTTRTVLARGWSNNSISECFVGTKVLLCKWRLDGHRNSFCAQGGIAAGYLVGHQPLGRWTPRSLSLRGTRHGCQLVGGKSGPRTCFNAFTPHVSTN